MATLEAGSWAWVPDPKEMYIPGKVLKTFKAGEEGKFKLEDGKDLTLPAGATKDALPMDEAALKTYDNMIKLNDLNEPTILHNLRQRFLKDDIYTYVSSILVACNPFKLLPIYTPDVMEKYKDGKGRDQPPHIYAISDNAYRNLMESYKDQAVVISGESGAGKTETMKLVLQFLADVSGRASKQTAGGEKTESLEQQILKSNPVMEAFGNAKTTRNNNSSRFGKWTEIKFNRYGTIVGGSIINYLLEKSRIPFQAPQERNYHVFYQLLAGGELDLEMKRKYKLKDAEEFHYMNQSGVTTVDTINDEKDWLEMSGAMDVLNMSVEQKECVFRLVAAILQLGNVEFERDPKGSEETDSKVKNPDQLKLAAELLRVDGDAFAKTMCYKAIRRPGAKSVTYARYSITKACDARDATTKSLYGKLFDWLISMINKALSGIGGEAAAGAAKEKVHTIGVLDIFGFESFATNSFEQLCINYCNEKLQFHFNEYIFKLEQAEYASEGVPVDLIEFKDNQPTLDLLEARGTGVFAMVDEEINVPKGSDEGFLKKVITKHEKHPNFAKPRPKDLNANLVFIIVHYAGAVPYNVTSFLEKNKDALHEDIVEVIGKSACPLIKTLLVDESADAGGKRGPSRKATLGHQFKTSLEGLMTSLYRCEPHFVRCMKSNHVKKGNVFESEMMMAQLRYAGLLEVCRIRKVGFPVRKKFDEFLFRYRCLDLAKCKDHKMLCESLSAKGLLKPRQWVIGHTKVFMRNLQQQELEEAREASLMGVVMKMQAAARRFICRCRYIKYKAIIKGLREAIGKRTEEALEAALADVPELPFGGGHVKEVKEARALKERLEEERRIVAMCAEAVKNRDLAELKNACKAAEDAAFDAPVVGEARKLRDLMERERAAVKKLKDAIDARSLDDINAAIAAADPFGAFVTGTDTYAQATALRERILQENACRESLKAAIASRDYAKLEAALNRATELNVTDDLVNQANALRAELEEQENALRELRDATTERTLEAVQNALKRCKKVGLPDGHAEVAAGKELEARLGDEKATEDELSAAADSKDLARIDKALAKAASMKMPETNGVRKASKMAERLRAEADAMDGLRKAIKSNKATVIVAAVNRCNELGLEGKELDAAKEALSKLGAQSEALLRLSEAVNRGDIDGIDKELAALEKMGLGEEDEVKKAREDKKRIVKQNKCAEALEAAVGKREREALTAALAEAEELNLRVRFPELHERASKLAEALDSEESAGKAFRRFVEADDEAGLEEAIEKARGNGASEAVLAKGEEARKALGDRKGFIKRLTDAMEAEPKDKEALQKLVEEAAELGIKGAKVDAASQLLNRDKAAKETRRALKRAMKGTDEKALAEAIEKAIQCGMEAEEEVTKAKAQKKRLEEEKELAADVRAAMKVLTVKAESKSGVTPSDLEPLDAAIEDAKAKGLSEDSPFMLEAKTARQRIADVLQLQADIAKVLDTDNLRAMKKVLDRAEEMDLGNSSLVKKLRSRIREVERARSAKALMDDDVPEEATPSLDDEEMKRQREEKMRKASHPKYTWDKFSKIRNGDDFAKDVLLFKKKVKAGQLRWISTLIPTSMTEFTNRELVKLAKAVHKCILGYTGDKSMSFPATLAQDILQKGLETPDLVDEIYVQLCKHLTMNPRPESAVRAWQLMCMCVGTFPPSRDFENHLINFILQHKDGAGAVGNYARYSLRRLEGILNSGPSGFVPSVEEISAYKERPPILATIELVDGTPLTEDLPITPDLNVAKVLDICYHFLELGDPRMQYFGIFVEDVEDPMVPPVDAHSEDAPPYAGLPKTPRPLQNENFMGDVVTVKVRQNQPFKFVFKRKIFLKNVDGPSEDPMFERLTYLQAVDEVVNGNIPLDAEEDVVRLTTQAMVVDLMDNFPKKADELIESDLMQYVPKTWRDNKTQEEWAADVLRHYKKFKEDKRTYEEMEAEEIQSKFVDAVRDHPLYGTNFFHVRRHKFPEQMEAYPEHCIIALNSEGLHFLNEANETLSTYGYADIYRWGGSSTQFSIIIWNPETQDTDDVSMFTSQAADMAALILDYINAIMASNES